MKSGRTYTDYLNDILDAIKKAESFIDSITVEEFKKDDKTIFATVRALESLAKPPNESRTKFASNIPPSLGEKWPECETNSLTIISASISK